jgi:DNA-binding PadR family transcriptional regulator
LIRIQNVDDLEPVPLVRVLLLALLHKYPESSGYDMMKTITEFTNNALELSSGTIYSELRRLEQQGLLESKRESTGRRRRAYLVTQKGTEELKNLKNQIKTRMAVLLGPLVDFVENQLQI